MKIRRTQNYKFHSKNICPIPTLKERTSHKVILKIHNSINVNYTNNYNPNLDSRTINKKQSQKEGEKKTEENPIKIY